MRVRQLEVRNIGPLKRVSVSDLANVVVLAGPNGVGKTNINNALLQLARHPTPNTTTWMVVEATDAEEGERWGKSTLDTRVLREADILRAQLQKNQRRNRYQGSFLNFDSDRAIRNVQGFNFSWDIGNPLSEDVSWAFGMESLQTRYNDVRHSLFRLIESQKREIAETVLTLQKNGEPLRLDPFPDVLEPYKQAFWRLLAPKKLVEVDVRAQEIFYEVGGQKLPINTLSSGEKEVVNIVFDFLLREPRHCVVVFDEPELHLHPELSYKLLQTLSGIGVSNQFIFSTHSPEIISASLENTVVFVTPPKGDDDNQAIIVHRDDATHHALQALGQSIGVISLGKHLLLIEGEETSLDKQTYGAILKNRFPEFVLVPVGGKDKIRSFDDVKNNILNKTIWGVSFYLLCDRDATVALDGQDMSSEASKKVKVLPRYHLENYFLDENVLAQVFCDMEPIGSWLRDPTLIKNKLLEIARSVVPYASALKISAAVRQKVGNASTMPKGVDGTVGATDLSDLFAERAQSELNRISCALDKQAIQSRIVAEYNRLHAAVAADDPLWRTELPGRRILNQFAAAAQINVGRLKTLYLAKADHGTTFSEIVSIFQDLRDGR